MAIYGESEKGKGTVQRNKKDPETNNNQNTFWHISYELGKDEKEDEKKEEGDEI
jgi:hypothetical protein